MPEGVVADKAYDLPRNHWLLKSKGIVNRIIRRRGRNARNNAQRYVVKRTTAIIKRGVGLQQERQPVAVGGENLHPALRSHVMT